jgi:hypothetical protein
VQISSVPYHSPSEVAFGIAELESYKSAGSDPIMLGMIQAGGEAIQSDIHKLINSIWIKEELPNQWKEFMITPINRNFS